MPLKYVYVLVSSGRDYYTEQALMSMHSLRMHNPHCHIVLALDPLTMDSIDERDSPIRDYVSELAVIETPEGFTPLQRSRFVKTSVRQHVSGDFLYLDCDTVITGSLKGLEDISCDVAAAAYRHIRNRPDGSIPRILRDYHSLVGVDAESLDYSFFCNGGVILCKDNETGHRLYELWHYLWQEGSVKYGYHSDQSSLWRANAELGGVISELDGSYNCQMIYPQSSLEYSGGCIIFHYHAAAYNLNRAIPFKSPVFLEKIRRNGITAEAEDAMRNVMDNYLGNLLVLGGEDLKVYNSPAVLLGRKLSRDYAWTNKAARLICRLFGCRV